MNFILQDNSKFENLGPSSEFDNTAKIEAHIQRRLLQLKKEGLLPSMIYSRIRPTGSQRPQMYGLPKIHKQDVPLRSILSMTGSAQHFNNIMNLEHLKIQNTNCFSVVCINLRCCFFTLHHSQIRSVSNKSHLKNIRKLEI